MPKDYILYFDGHCLLCQFWVKVFLRLDGQKKFVFASLQSDFARQRVPEKWQQIDSIVFEKNGQFYSKSTAILLAAAAAKPVFYIFYVFFLLPRVVRDFFYDLVAKNRYKYFGKSDTCEIPDANQKDRFIL